MLTALLLQAALAAEPLPKVACTPPADGEPLRIVVLGDTGKKLATNRQADKEKRGCLKHELGRKAPSWIVSIDESKELMKAIGAEKKNLTVLVGDMYYEFLPASNKEDAIKDRVLTFGGGFPTPTWWVFGNHDVQADPVTDREEFLKVALDAPEIEMPAAQYVGDLGYAWAVVVDTNKWDGFPEQEISKLVGAGTGKPLLIFAHHPYREPYNKCNEDGEVVAPDEGGNDHGIPKFLKGLEAKGTPVVWVAGHAHLLQYGIYDGIDAIVSGSASEVREVSPKEGQTVDPPGADPTWSESRFGYAVIEVHKDGKMKVDFRMYRESDKIFESHSVDLGVK